MKTIYTSEDHEYLKAVGQRIREGRLKTGQSQETFAGTCNLDRTYISDVERGERNISLLNLKKLADALEVPLSSLVG
jgi:transcriptional regulator with XRE-family HTH domain